MDYKKSFEDIEKALIELQDENKITPILVEGDKDIEALRKLGINGIIISINTGKSLSNFCDMLAQKYVSIIILTDWDRKGGYLSHIIQKNLKGRVKCNTYYREIFAKNAMIKTLEGLPSWLSTIQDKLNSSRKEHNKINNKSDI